MRAKIDEAEDDGIAHIDHYNGHVEEQGTHMLLENVRGWFDSLWEHRILI